MNLEQFSHEIEQDGYSVQRSVVPPLFLRDAAYSIEQHKVSPHSRLRSEEFYGMRNLLREVPEVRQLVSSQYLGPLVIPILGKQAVAVRGLYFDKTPRANWRLGWHQDRAIAVTRRADLPNYGPWSVKAGVTHVFPPSSILKSMLTIRLHIDACTSSTGALRVIPGTHQSPLDDSAFSRLANERGVVSCDVNPGDAVVMRPLIAHSSEKSDDPEHRRVIHIEFAKSPLEEPLQWYESISLEAA